MDSQDAVSALSSVGITSVPVEPILGGWAYWTFDVGSRFIARFPRNDEIAEATVREIAILPALSNEVSYLVPIPSRIGVWLDRPFMVYSRIPGRGLTQADDSRELLFALRDMLAQRHRFPVERASELLGCGSPQRAWRAYFEDMWPVIETVALPAIDVPKADRVRTEFGQFLDTRTARIFDRAVEQGLPGPEKAPRRSSYSLCASRWSTFTGQSMRAHFVSKSLARSMRLTRDCAVNGH